MTLRAVQHTVHDDLFERVINNALGEIQRDWGVTIPGRRLRQRPPSSAAKTAYGSRSTTTRIPCRTCRQRSGPPWVRSVESLHTNAQGWDTGSAV